MLRALGYLPLCLARGLFLPALAVGAIVVAAVLIVAKGTKVEH